MTEPESLSTTQYRAMILRLAEDGCGADALNDVLAQWSCAGWRLHSHSLSPFNAGPPDVLVMLVFVREDVASIAEPNTVGRSGPEAAEASTDR